MYQAVANIHEPARATRATQMIERMKMKGWDEMQITSARKIGVVNNVMNGMLPKVVKISLLT
jgi:hypothetical protein